MSNTTTDRASVLFSTPFVAESIKAASLSPANPRSAKSGSAKPYAPTSRAMPRFARFTPRASALLATTSIAALLLGAAPVEAGGLSFSNNPMVPVVNNPVNTTITSIVINGSTVTGAMTNMGTITPGLGVNAGPGLFDADAILVLNGSIGGGILNSGAIAATATSGGANGILTVGSIIGGGITNTGTIGATSTTNGLSARGILAFHSVVSGGISNAANIITSGPGALGILTVSSPIAGGVTNSGSITSTGTLSPFGGADGIDISNDINGLPLSGGITNSGTIIATSQGEVAFGINVANVIFTGSGPTGGISNTGTIIATALNGIGISIGGTVAAAAVTNSGTIIARGAASGTGVLVGGGLTGGITNTGTIFGSSDAIRLIGLNLASKTTFGSSSSIDQAIQVNATTVTQSAGALIGGVVGSGTDILNVTGGTLSLQPTSAVSGFATLNQSGGNVVLQVTPSNAAGQFPTVNVGNLTLTGVLEVAPQSGSFAPGQTITYANVFTGSSSLNNGIANVLVFGFFSNAVTASLTPGNTSPLSLTLTNNSGMALTPGVASGAGTFTTLTNPLGAILPAVSVTKGASVNGAIVNLGFIGNLKLPGPSTTGILISGGSVNQGIINVGTIAGTVAAIDVSGATGPTAIKQGAGTISGAIKLSANADTLTINGGSVVGDIVGAGTTDTVNVDPVNNANNIFTYANTISGIGAINIASNANLALTAQGVLNNNIGVLTLTPTSRISGNGTFTQGAAGTAVLQFTNNTASGAFPTINASTITLAGKLQVALTGAFPASGMEDFVKVFAASGTLTNTISPSNVTVVASGATLPAGTSITAKLVQSGNSADVVVVETAPAAHVGFASRPGLTGNEVSVANALDAVLAADTKASQPLLMALLHLDAQGLPQAFDALSGEVHSSVITAAYEDALLPQSAILDRLNQPLSPPWLGIASAMTGGYAADLPSGKGPRVAPVAVRMFEPRLFDFWGQAFGDWGRVSSDGNAVAISRSTGGFVLGGDVTATNLLGADWRFGLAGGYTSDRITASQRLSSANFESVFGGAYAGASFGAVRLRAGALYGTNSTSTSRSVVFPGFADALSASYGGSTAQAFGEAGYRIELAGASLGGLAFSRASVEPFADAAAILIHQNGFTESGGIAALTGFGRDFNIQTTALGVRSEIALASMPLTLKTMLGWRHAYGDVVPSVLLGFQGGAQAFSVSGIPIDRDAFVAEAGIDYSLTSMLSVGVSYSGQFGQRAMDNAFKGNVNLRF